MWRRPLFKRELQTVSIFDKACSIIRRLKEENNMWTQLEPAKRFEIRPIELIKQSIEKKRFKKITETKVEEEKEIKASPKRRERKRKIEEISKELDDETKESEDFSHENSENDQERSKNTVSSNRLKFVTHLKPNVKPQKKHVVSHKSKRAKLSKILYWFIAIENSDSSSIIKAVKIFSKNSKKDGFKTKTKESEISNSEVKKARDYIIWASGLNPTEYNEFKSFWANFEIEIDDDVDNCFTTHIIVKDMKKTAKYIKAVFYKVNIVSFDWIVDSMYWNPPEMKNIDKYLFRLGKSANQEVPNSKHIFRGMNFIVSSTLKSVDSLKDLDLEYFIIALGGITHRTMRSAIKELDSEKEEKSLYHVVDGNESYKNPPNWMKPKVPILNINYKWVIDCVWDGSLLPLPSHQISL